MTQLVTALVFALALALPARAIPLVPVNGDFEDPTQPFRAVGIGNLGIFDSTASGWTVEGAGGAYRPVPNIQIGEAGPTLAYINSGRMYQVLSTVIDESQRYSFTVEFFRRSDNNLGNWTGSFGIFAGGDPDDVIARADVTTAKAPPSFFRTVSAEGSALLGRLGQSLGVFVELTGPAQLNFDAGSNAVAPIPLPGALPATIGGWAALAALSTRTRARRRRG